MSENWYKPTANGIMLTLHIQPGGKRTEVCGKHADALKIRIAAPPVEGQANACLLAFLKRIFDVPASQVLLKQGHNSRKKVVEIRGSAHPATKLFESTSP